jgi:hypothetical protein
MVELVMGIEPMNLVLTKDALYQLSYTSTRNPRKHEFISQTNLLETHIDSRKSR